MKEGFTPHPFSDVALYLRYIKNMVLVDVQGNGVELVHAPFLGYEAPELQGKRISAEKIKSSSDQRIIG